MKKTLIVAMFALIAGSTSGLLARSCGFSCKKACEPCPPICTKTVRVEAKKIVCPQPDLIEHIPQPAKKICIPQPPIPQPDRIEYVCQPDLVVHHKQPDLVRYECPVGTNENPGC